MIPPFVLPFFLLHAYFLPCQNNLPITFHFIFSLSPKEYDVSIPENVPFGTPLANLDMEVKDTDTGPNALFKIELIDNTGKFSVEPRM